MFHSPPLGLRHTYPFERNDGVNKFSEAAWSRKLEAENYVEQSWSRMAAGNDSIHALVPSMLLWEYRRSRRERAVTDHQCSQKQKISLISS